jgi:predicted HTH domain antitoxin
VGKNEKKIGNYYIFNGSITALIRKFILQMLKEYELKRMAELYRKGIVSLQEAATQAKLSLYEIMEYVQKENIHPPDQTKEEVLTEIEKSKKYDI